MSRKFLDDNIEIKNTIRYIPGGLTGTSLASTSFDPGHTYSSLGTGTKYRNEGNRGPVVGSLFGNDIVNRKDFRDDFYLLPQLVTVFSAAGTTSANIAAALAADKYFVVSGVNAVSSCAAFSTGGGVTLTTTTASADQVILGPPASGTFANAFNEGFLSSNRPIFETTIATGAAVTLEKIWAGYKLTVANDFAGGTDDDQVGFEVTSTATAGTWKCYYSIAGVDTVVDTGITIVASTHYHLKIVVNESGGTTNIGATFYINDVPVANTGTNALTAAITYLPAVAVQTSTTAARAATVYVIRCSKDNL